MMTAIGDIKIPNRIAEVSGRVLPSLLVCSRNRAASAPSPAHRKPIKNPINTLMPELFHVVLDNASGKMYDLHMDTETTVFEEFAKIPRLKRNCVITEKTGKRWMGLR